MWRGSVCGREGHAHTRDRHAALFTKVSRGSVSSQVPCMPCLCAGPFLFVGLGA